MSILAKYNAAMEAKDEAAMNEILHDDYKFTMHASGNVLGKADVIKWAMSGDIKRDKIRVLFENKKNKKINKIFGILIKISVTFTIFDIIFISLDLITIIVYSPHFP